MYELGKILKSSRNKKYLTIEEVSSITKIKDHYIEALENEDLEQLPARVYAVGFLNNLADLYDLSSADLIMAFDNIYERSKRQKPKKTFSGLGRDLVLRNTDKTDVEKQKEQDLFEKHTLIDEEKEEANDEEDIFSKIKELSLDDKEKSDDSKAFIDNYIKKSKDELKALAIKNELEKELFLSKEKPKSDVQDDTYPTSKIMLEFEELMREEERFNTQKLRKQETERNINRTKNKLSSRKSFNFDGNAKNGASLMVLVLLITAILVLIYIIVTALLAQ